MGATSAMSARGPSTRVRRPLAQDLRLGPGACPERGPGGPESKDATSATGGDLMMRGLRYLPIVFSVAIARAAAQPAAQPQSGPDDVRAHYTKYEYMVPMRDGVRLFTSIYAPKDTSQK